MADACTLNEMAKLLAGLDGLSDPAEAGTIMALIFEHLEVRFLGEFLGVEN
jgi:hypothetical protein